MRDYGLIWSIRFYLTETGMAGWDCKEKLKKQLTENNLSTLKQMGNHQSYKTNHSDFLPSLRFSTKEDLNLFLLLLQLPVPSVGKMRVNYMVSEEDAWLWI
jgi:hypothetical protein